MKQKFINNGSDHKNLPFHSFRSDDLTCWYTLTLLSWIDFYSCILLPPFYFIKLIWTNFMKGYLWTYHKENCIIIYAMIECPNKKLPIDNTFHIFIWYGFKSFTCKTLWSICVELYRSLPNQWIHKIYTLQGNRKESPQGNFCVRVDTLCEHAFVWIYHQIQKKKTITNRVMIDTNSVKM